jgi:CRP/FNR family transcriptional regulator, anaerobic regulatory protein
MPTIGLDGVPPVAASTVISIRDLKTHCMTCSMRELCLPVGLEREAMHQLDQLVGNRKKFKRGETIYGTSEPFTALYAIRLGSCKTTVLAEDGREQVAGYHMPGDLVGLDGIGHERHGGHAVALEDLVFALNFGTPGRT